jgi:hypothetical protein
MNIIEQQLNSAMPFPDDVLRNDTVQTGTHPALHCVTQYHFKYPNFIFFYIFLSEPAIAQSV